MINLLRPVLYYSVLSISFFKCLVYSYSERHRLKSPVIWRFLFALSLFTFAATWYFIGKFLVEDYLESSRVWSQYFEHSDLFDGAYRMVSDSDSKWWWSKRHLITAVSWTALLWMESLEGSIWYILLGFFGAVGASFPLWLIRHLGNGRKLLRKGTGGFVSNFTFCFGTVLSLAALLSIAITPETVSDSKLFSWNLWLLHVHLLLIFLQSSTVLSRTQKFSFWLILTAASVLALYYEQRWLFSSHQDLWNAFWNENSCQTSISIDAISTLISILVFIYYSSPSVASVIFFSVLSIFAWPISFPLFMAFQFT